MSVTIDQVGICNLALTKVGSSRISDIDEDIKAAKALKAGYGIMRLAALRDHSWRFATKRVILYPVADAPAWGFEHAFDIPNDCVQVQGLDNEEIEWAVENGQILSDEDTLNVKYTFDQDDESAFTPDFAEAFAFRLAIHVGFLLTNSISLIESLRKEYHQYLGEARSKSGTEGTLPELQATTWINARR